MYLLLKTWTLRVWYQLFNNSVITAVSCDGAGCFPDGVKSHFYSGLTQFDNKDTQDFALFMKTLKDFVVL